VVKYGKAGQTTYDNIFRRVRFAYWMNTATDTHSEYVIFIAYPLQQWVHERPSILRYTYIVCLINQAK